ncbi:uncharacterized protein LOC113496728 [Trichoplusia ni]|uniref:Uncharacterized protein LOC113496728 n=1 Tax=Trichoplusia ni TaxID=7111 RepID=A0A7E5VUA9_TRINI|nr:uncharacterized protein LOC113496728 [Trichoplusia ni]
MAQILSGHGCFGNYLLRIARREATPCCHHCNDSEDNAQHTLEVCPAWAIQRQTVVAVVGGDLSLPSVVASMVGSEESWRAVAEFSDEVMALKESAERERELSTTLPIRARRTRAKRRADNALFQPP